ncbi:unnamed protein product [Prorocentrum cordatum]|uniref:Uncharacterized protein n=1 Tax=Prorocentrum cordatum TaxID=2364126 RepID=A0ABN9VZI2_9DINO|nr:unnamed protein product [Polarella glacialis]
MAVVWGVDVGQTPTVKRSNTRLPVAANADLRFALKLRLLRQCSAVLEEVLSLRESVGRLLSDAKAQADLLDALSARVDELHTGFADHEEELFGGASAAYRPYRGAHAGRARDLKAGVSIGQGFGRSLSGRSSGSRRTWLSRDLGDGSFFGGLDREPLGGGHGSGLGSGRSHASGWGGRRARTRDVLGLAYKQGIGFGGQSEAVTGGGGEQPRGTLPRRRADGPGDAGGGGAQDGSDDVAEIDAELAQLRASAASHVALPAAPERCRSGAVVLPPVLGPTVGVDMAAIGVSLRQLYSVVDETEADARAVEHMAARGTLSSGSRAKSKGKNKVDVAERVRQELSLASAERRELEAQLAAARAAAGELAAAAGAEKAASSRLIKDMADTCIGGAASEKGQASVGAEAKAHPVEPRAKRMPEQRHEQGRGHGGGTLVSWRG